MSPALSRASFPDVVVEPFTLKSWPASDLANGSPNHPQPKILIIIPVKIGFI